MARPRKIVTAPPLSPGEATYVIERLVADRRIAPLEVTRCIAAMHQEIADLEQRLDTLRAASNGGFVPQGTAELVKRPAPVTPPKSRRRSRKPASAEVRASQQLQGRYVSLIRQFPKYKRGQYQKIAKSRGRQAAVTEMRRVLGT